MAEDGTPHSTLHNANGCSTLKDGRRRTSGCRGAKLGSQDIQLASTAQRTRVDATQPGGLDQGQYRVLRLSIIGGHQDVQRSAGNLRGHQGSGPLINTCGPRDTLGLFSTRDPRGPPFSRRSHDCVDGPPVTAPAGRVLRWLRRAPRRSPGVMRPPRVAPVDLGSAGC